MLLLSQILVLLLLLLVVVFGFCLKKREFPYLFFCVFARPKVTIVKQERPLLLLGGDNIISPLVRQQNPRKEDCQDNYQHCKRQARTHSREDGARKTAPQDEREPKEKKRKEKKRECVGVVLLFFRMDREDQRVFSFPSHLLTPCTHPAPSKGAVRPSLLFPLFSLLSSLHAQPKRPLY